LEVESLSAEAGFFAAFLSSIVLTKEETKKNSEGGFDVQCWMLNLHSSPPSDNFSLSKNVAFSRRQTAATPL
jgi:hypothetical protein